MVELAIEWLPRNNFVKKMRSGCHKLGGAPARSCLKIKKTVVPQAGTHTERASPRTLRSCCAGQLEGITNRIKVMKRMAYD
jgi:hypothetical protein